jgi:predicted nucleic acid-binding protein
MGPRSKSWSTISAKSSPQAIRASQSAAAHPSSSYASSAAANPSHPPRRRTRDAAAVAIVERLNEHKLATLDHRHFATIRPKYTYAIELLPH